MTTISNHHQKTAELLKDRIREIQEIAEELESDFPRVSDEDKIINSLVKKVVDRLSSAHDISIRLDVQLEKIKNEREH